MIRSKVPTPLLMVYEDNDPADDKPPADDQKKGASTVRKIQLERSSLRPEIMTDRYVSESKVKPYDFERSKIPLISPISYKSVAALTSPTFRAG